jgi:hypothetical protein
MELGDQIDAPAALFPEGNSQYPLNERLNESQGRSGYSLPVIEPRCLTVQPVAYCVYRLRYFWLQSYYRTCFDLPFLLSSFSRLQQNSLMQNAAEDLYRTEERTVLIVTNLWYRSDVWLEVSRHPGQRVASHTTSLNQVLVHLSADSAAPWCDRIHCHVSKL